VVKRRNSRIRKTNTANWGQRGVSTPLAATILVPAGKCPFIIEEYSRDNVVDWIISLTEEKASVITYDRDVYVYWLRQSFDINGKDYAKARQVVLDVVPQRVKTLEDLELGT
jgi:hypothetical protein